MFAQRTKIMYNIKSKEKREENALNAFIGRIKAGT
jgi:hypothetical protein